MANMVNFLQQRGWRSTRFSSRARCNDALFDFHKEAALALEAKHLLNALLEEQHLSIMPRTYAIDIEHWPQVLAAIGESANHTSWILKPALMNNGQGIKIIQSLDEVADFFCSPHCLIGPYVLQEYIEPPHLLQGPEKGHKYSLRYFVIMSNVWGNYLYRQGYANIALMPYEAFNYSDVRAHLTNEHLSGERLNVIQRPIDELPLLQQFFPQIETVCRSLMGALKTKYPLAFDADKRPELALLGVDFMVDQQERLWMLEVNHGPCFPVDDGHPLFASLYCPFWEALIDLLFYSDNASVPQSFIRL